MADVDKTFMSDENIPRRYNYKVYNWVKEKEHPRRRKRIKESELDTVDFMVVEVEPEDKKQEVTYITIWGPFEDWQNVEGILGYDYGTEGSRIYPTSKAA